MDTEVEWELCAFIGELSFKLTWIFKLSSDFVGQNSQYVRAEGIEWNTFEKTVLEWRRVFGMIRSAESYAQKP